MPRIMEGGFSKNQVRDVFKREGRKKEKRNRYNKHNPSNSSKASQRGMMRTCGEGANQTLQA